MQFEGGRGVFVVLRAGSTPETEFVDHIGLIQIPDDPFAVVGGRVSPTAAPLLAADAGIAVGQEEGGVFFQLC